MCAQHGDEPAIRLISQLTRARRTEPYGKRQLPTTAHLRLAKSNIPVTCDLLARSRLRRLSSRADSPWPRSDEKLHSRPLTTHLR